MVYKCKSCNQRCRDNKTCKNNDCAQFCPDQRGHRWQRERLASVVGGIASKVGSFAAGGFILSLLHRPDVRCGVAARMVLQHLGFGMAQRMELLTTLYPAYWKWSTSVILNGLIDKLVNLQEANDKKRAKIIDQCWEAMVEELETQQVLAFTAERRVVLLPRTESCRETKGKQCHGYHAFRNPAGRRTGDAEWKIMMKDVASGRLRRACEELAQEWSKSDVDITYARSVQILDAQNMSYLRADNSNKYAKIRFVRWLLKCEGRQATLTPNCWKLLTGMGSGAEKGLEASGIETFAEAVEACAIITHTGACDKTNKFDLDDLICFMCMSQHREVRDAETQTLPDPPPPVSVKDDLVGVEEPSGAVQAGVSVGLPGGRVRTAELEVHTLRSFLTAFVTLLLSDLMRFLPLRGWAPVTQTCQALRNVATGNLETARLHCMACRALICTMIQRIARRFSAGALRAGTLLRVQAYAWDLLEMCPPSTIAVEEEMLAVMVLRVGVKYEMRHPDASLALQEVPMPTQLVLARAVEHRLLNLMFRHP